MTTLNTVVVNGEVVRAVEVLIATGKKTWAGGQAAGTFVLREDGASTAGAGTSAEGAFYLDPTKTPTVRLWASVLANTVAPGCDFTFRIKPLGTTAGSTSGVIGNETGQSVTSGTTLTFSAPGAGATAPQSINFACPTAGYYVCEVVTSATTAATSGTVNRFRVLATSFT